MLIIQSPVQWDSACICFRLSWRIRPFKVKVWTKPNGGSRGHVISGSNHMTFSVAFDTSLHTLKGFIAVNVCSS